MQCKSETSRKKDFALEENSTEFKYKSLSVISIARGGDSKRQGELLGEHFVS